MSCWTKEVFPNSLRFIAKRCWYSIKRSQTDLCCCSVHDSIPLRSKFSKSLWSLLPSLLGGFLGRLLFGVFPATPSGMFSSNFGVNIGGTTLPTIMWAIFVPFLNFTAWQDKFHNITCILLDPGLKIWIWCATTMSLQHCSFGRSSIVTLTCL